MDKKAKSNVIKATPEKEASGPEALLPLGKVPEQKSTVKPKQPGVYSAPKQSTPAAGLNDIKQSKPSPATKPKSKIVDAKTSPTTPKDNLGWPESIPDDNINPADIIDLSDDSGRY